MENLESLCMVCMEDTRGSDFCPNCGASTTILSDDVQYSKALKLRTLLQGRYLIGKSVDINGEGIGYICYDTSSQTPVYVREFFPINLCERLTDNKTVLVRPRLEKNFKILKSEYLEYNRRLASMRGTSSIFPIYDIFDENNTSYVVAEWQENIELSEYVARSGGYLSWNDARVLFMPVLSTLSQLCDNNIHHYGISPQNLVILKDGKMRIKGFSIQEERHAFSILKPELFDGYSAPEQYIKNVKLGEFSDIYGFVASLFFALTGEVPQISNKRKEEKLLISTEALKEIPPHVVTAMTNAMQVNKDLRTAKFEHLRAELSLSPTIKVRVEDIVSNENSIKDSFIDKDEIKNSKKTHFSWPLISVISILVVLCAILLLYISFHSNYTDKKADELISSSAIPVSSSNLDQIDVPNLVGTNYEQAKNYGQTQKNYQVRLSSNEFSDTVPQGFIISQTPEYTAGKKINKASVIAVVVSKGSQMRILPSIAGKTLSEASAELTKNGFVPQKASEEYNDSYESGMVIDYQTNKSGDKLEYGSVVNIIVSKGKEKSTDSENVSQ